MYDASYILALEHYVRDRVLDSFRMCDTPQVILTNHRIVVLQMLQLRRLCSNRTDMMTNHLRETQVEKRDRLHRAIVSSQQ